MPFLICKSRGFPQQITIFWQIKTACLLAVLNAIIIPQFRVAFSGLFYCLAFSYPQFLFLDEMFLRVQGKAQIISAIPFAS
jgi:hypothetical protein